MSNELGIGLQPFYNDAVAATVVAVKGAGAALVYWLKIINTTGAAAYLQIFNAPAASVTLGTTAPAWVVPLAANESQLIALPFPLEFGGSGLSIAGTTTPTGNSAATLKVSTLYG